VTAPRGAFTYPMDDMRSMKAASIIPSVSLRKPVSNHHRAFFLSSPNCPVQQRGVVYGWTARV
jgi:hypothetical protein